MRRAAPRGDGAAVLLGVVLLLLLGVAFPVGAQAEAWLPAEGVADDINSMPVLAVAPSGGPVAAYVGNSGKIVVVVRRAGGLYERADVVPVVDGNPDLTVVGVGEDAAGGVAVAYTRTSGSSPVGSTAYAASRPAGSTTFTDRTLAGGQPLGAEDWTPVFTVLPDGTMLMARSSDAGIRVDAGPIGGSFSRTEVHPGINEFRGPLALATNPSGDALIALPAARIDGAPANTRVPALILLRRSARGVLDAETSIADATAEASTTPPNNVVPLTASAALAPDGSADVVWGVRLTSAAGTSNVLRAVHLPAGTTTSDTPAASRALATVGSTGPTPRTLAPPVVARDAAGDGATVAYSYLQGGSGEAGGGNGHLFAAVRNASAATYGPATELTDTPAPRTLAGAVPLAATAELVLDEPPGRLIGRTHLPGAGYGPPETISQFDLLFLQSTARVVAAGGLSGAVATHIRGPVTTLSMQVHDATPPLLDLAGVPARTPAGSPVTVPSGVSDGADAAPSVAWDFGDGTTGSGAAPSHAWALAGTFAVRATATDAAGNVASAERTVTVVSAPPAAPAGTGTGAPLPAPVTRDTTAPALGRLKLSPARIRRTRPITRLTASLSERATFTVAVTRSRPGVKRGRTCRATAKRVAKARRCTATRTVLRVRALRDASPRMTLRLTLKKRPSRGKYVVRIVAADAAGNRSRARTATLRVR